MGAAGADPGSSAAPLPVLRPDPPAGRVFAAQRVVRSTDVTREGRLRLDALARYLQDVAEDDVADAGLAEPYAWVLRRVSVAIRGWPGHAEPVGLRTYCSGTGPRWAERTTTVTRAGADLMQATATWAAVGQADGRPAPLGPEFHRIYGPSAQGRRVSTRLNLPGPPGPPAPPGPPGPRAARPWPLRVTDFDPIGHVNNSVHWAAVEDVMADLDWRPASAGLDYNRPILPGCLPALVSSRADGQLSVWLLNAGQRLASARLARLPE
jgi:acyl-ACP thioesterase